MIDSIFTAKSDSLDPRNLHIALKEDTFKTKTLLLLPGSIGNLHERTQDTMVFQYYYALESELSGLAITINGLDSTSYYQASVMMNKKEIEQFSIQNLSTYEALIKPLFPGEYSLILFEDRNNNGKWDSGNYDEKRQAEKRRIFTLDKLRANWEVESIINWE